MIKLFSGLIIILLTYTSCKSQPEQKVQLSDTSLSAKLKKYRQLFWDSLPKPVGWVNDFEDVFSEKQENTLDSIISAFEEKDGIEISIVTIDSLKTSKEKFDDLILHIGNTWRVGKKYINNGIVIGISVDYRKIRIENGYGIEKILSNQETKEIIDKFFTPYYKQNKYYQGTLNGLNALIDKLTEALKK